MGESLIFIVTALTLGGIMIAINTFIKANTNHNGRKYKTRVKKG